MKKVLLSGMIGNSLEWYDYAIYGHMALIIGQQFFPSENPTTQLLASFGAFAVGFIARPFGGMLFGWISDRFGRKISLSLSIIMMAICTGMIGLMPNYASIGIAAPILLTLVRILQGLSLGGEFSGAITYMVEHAPAHRRGLVGSMAMLSLVFGFLLGSLTATTVAFWMDESTFQDWGWRLPFLMGVLIGMIGLYIRQHCDESPTYIAARASNLLSETPLRDALRHHWAPMLRAVGVYFLVTMPFYIACVYFIAYNRQSLGLGLADALLLNSLSMLVMMLAVPLAAHYTDRMGRKPILQMTALAFLFLSFPLFYAMASNDLWLVIAAQLFFSILVGINIGPVPALLAEMFPTSVRTTGMAIAYNLAAALFGGTAPAISVWLVDYFGSIHPLGYYTMAAALVALASLHGYHDRSRHAL